MQLGSEGRAVNFFLGILEFLPRVGAPISSVTGAPGPFF
jgi:hypothetical protein